MPTATLRRPRRSEPVTVVPADALDLTPAQRTALHEVYQLILSFAPPGDPTQRRGEAEPGGESEEAPADGSSLRSSLSTATLCASAPLRRKRPPARNQGGHS